MIRTSLIVALTFLAAVPSDAAAKKQIRARKVAPAAVAAAPAQSAHRRSPYVGAAVAGEKFEVIRNDDGTVTKKPVWVMLSADNGNAEAYPASVTKLMTLLLVLEDVRAGKYSLGDAVTATPDVYRCEPSWVGIKAGETMSVRDLCLALMVESANDAAIALGVHAAGSFEGFVTRMNARAKELGMARTRYYNPNGLPPNAGKRYPWKSFNVSTASDQLRLAIRLVSMPETFQFTSVKTCDLVRTAGGFRVSVTRKTNAPQATTSLRPGETIVKQMRNHNNIMVKDKLKIHNADGSEAVDGLKTGYIDAGGSSVVLTAQYKGRRVVAVVLGSSTAKERDDHGRSLISDALGSVSW